VAVDHTDPNVALTGEQMRRMQEIKRNIGREVQRFIGTKAAAAREEAANLGEVMPAHEDAAIEQRLIAELSGQLQQAFEQPIRTTGALTDRLNTSRAELASKAFLNENTPQDTAFYSEVSRFYSQLCEIIEQKIRFAPENLPTPPASFVRH
jgi:hypothetical protein